MSFSAKDWKDGLVGGTPISAAALEDMETRLSGYTDTAIAAQAASTTGLYESKASAATITITNTARVVKITGAVEITKVNPTFAGHVVVFIIEATAKFVDGSNLKLSNPGPTTADDTLTLACDGVSWYEVGRSAN